MRALIILLCSLALISSFALLLFLYKHLCILYHRRLRVEPATSPETAPDKPPESESESAAAELTVARWRSRVLYTIKEEEREDADSDLEKGIGFGSDKEEPVPDTPFYTPASSPAREKTQVRQLSEKMFEVGEEQASSNSQMWRNTLTVNVDAL